MKNGVLASVLVVLAVLVSIITASDTQNEYLCWTEDNKLPMTSIDIMIIHTFQIRNIVEGADRKKRDVRNIYNLEIVFVIMMNHWGVMGLLFGSWVIWVLEGTIHKLLEVK